jgi:hypothetical protein
MVMIFCDFTFNGNLRLQLAHPQNCKNMKNKIFSFYFVILYKRYGKLNCFFSLLSIVENISKVNIFSLFHGFSNHYIFLITKMEFIS